MTNDLQKVKDLLKTRRCSERTINNYLSCLNRFKQYHKGKELKDLKEEDILDYLKVNLIDLDFAAASVNVNRAAIKYYYLVNFNIDFNNALLPSCKVKSRFPTLLTKEQVISIFNNEFNIKHKLWIILAYGSGLRISEVASLKVSDILSKEHKIRVIGKGNKERYVSLPKITLKLLRAYWLQNKDKITNFANYFGYSVDYVLGLSNNRKCNTNEEFSYIKLGNNIKKLRIKNNYSQNYLANRMKVTQACIVRWEKGITKISIPNLYELAKIFKISLNELCYSL